MAQQPIYLQNDPYGDKIKLAPFDWRDRRVLQWIDKFTELGWRDSVANLSRQKAKQTGALIRSIKWRTWADAGGDRQVWQVRYLYYAKFVELALGRKMPFIGLPPSIPNRQWGPIQMPDGRPRRAKPSIPTEMRKHAVKFTRMLENSYSLSGIAMLAFALGPSIENKQMIRRLMYETKGSKVSREAR